MSQDTAFPTGLTCAQQRFRSGCIFAKAHQSSISAWWCFGSLSIVFSLRKAFFFCLPSCFKRKHFVLIEHILSETICLFWFLSSCPIFTVKLHIQPKKWSYLLCKFYSKVIFGLRKYFLFFFAHISQQYCKNFRKNEYGELIENLPPSYLSYRFLYNLHSILLCGKSENIWISKNQWLE